MFNSYLTLKRFPDYLRILFAGIINKIGDNFDMLAISWLIYEITGSKFWFAINFTINAIPNLIIQPFIGAYIEKISKKKVMVLADFSRALIVFLLIVSLALGLKNPYIILIFTFLMTCFETIRQPASTAMIPHVLNSEHYETGTSLTQISTTLASIISMSLAGIVIAAFGTITALYVDLFSFLFSALILLRLKTEGKNNHFQEKAYKDSFIDGWQTFIQHPYLIKITLVIFLLQIFLTGINIVLTPITVEILFKGPETIAFFETTVLIGTLIGAFVYPSISNKYKTYQIFLISGALGSLGLVFMFIIPYVSNMILAMSLLLFLLSFGLGIVNPCLNVALIRSVDKSLLARTSSFLNAAIFGSVPIGSLITTLLMLKIPMTLILSIYGMIMLTVIIVFKNDTQLKRMV